MKTSKESLQCGSLSLSKALLIDTNQTLLGAAPAPAAADGTQTKTATSDESTENPSVYVRDILSNISSRKRKRSQVPSQEMVDNYDMKKVTAIRSNDVAKLREMLDDGESFDACNRNGETLLHLACRRSNLETVKFLIDEARVKADAHDDLGRNVFHDTCWRASPCPEMMGILVRLLSPELLLAEDARGHTCFDYARQQDWGQWIAFLQQVSPLLRRRAALVEAIQKSFEQE